MRRHQLAAALLAVAACKGGETPPPKAATAASAIQDRAAEAWGDKPSPTASGASGRNGSLVVAVAPSLIEPCTREAHPWTVLPPHSDEDSVYGVGRGPSPADALERARVEAAKSIEVTVTSDTEDTQVDWQQSGSVKRSEYTSKVKALSRSQVDRRLAECQQTSVCRAGPADVALLVACSKRSQLDRELAAAAKVLSASLPPNASVLLVPGTDERGWITGFGEYATQALRGDLSRTMRGDASLLKLPEWTPIQLAELARKAKATHFARIEHTTAGTGRLRISAWIQDAATDKATSPVRTFEVALDPDQLGLLDVRGPLLPQKAAMDMAADLGDRRVELRLSKTNLNAGEKVEFEIRVTEPSYVYVFDLYEDGNMALLVPGPDSPENLFAPDKPHRIPDDNWKQHGDALFACPIKGHATTKETVKVIASTRPLDLPGTSRATQEAATFDGMNGTAAELLRKLNDLRRSGVRFSDASVPYVIHATPGVKTVCP